MMAFGLPTAHTFTRLSQPPVTMTLPVFRPICRQLTVAPCAAKSCSFVAFCLVTCMSSGAG